MVPRILNFGTSWGWGFSFTPLPLYPGERAPDIHYTGDWVGFRAGLVEVAKIEKLYNVVYFQLLAAGVAQSV